MTISERRNYQVAVAVSILFHIALLFITFPSAALHRTVKMETIGAGLFDMPGGGDPVHGRTDIVANPGPESPEAVNTQAPLQAGIDNPQPVAIGKNDLKAPAVDTTSPKAETPQTQTGHLSSGGGGQPGPKPMSIGLGDGSGMLVGMGGGTKLQAPKSVQNDEVEGKVVLRILVKPDGTVEDIQFLEKSGDTRLDNYTAKIVRNQWRFKPHKEAYQIDISFNYQKNVNNYVATYHFINSQTRP